MQLDRARLPRILAAKAICRCTLRSTVPGSTRLVLHPKNIGQDWLAEALQIVTHWGTSFKLCEPCRFTLRICVAAEFDTGIRGRRIGGTYRFTAVVRSASDGLRASTILSVQVRPSFWPRMM